MTVATLKPADPPPERAELVPVYFETELIVTPEDNPTYSPAMLADLVESMREHHQLVPGWACPSPDLPKEKRLCLDGNRRLAVARMLGLPFWAFDLKEFVPEKERLRLDIQYNLARRVMSREEIARRAGRYMEITGCSAAEAAKSLSMSGPTLSRAFGERRIASELRPMADRLGPTIRSLIAAAPAAFMAQAIEFAATPDAAGKHPTRDQVAAFIRQMKTSGGRKPRTARNVTLKINGRPVTLLVGDKDSAFSVAEDLKALAAKLAKHSDVPADGWQFLFQ